MENIKICENCGKEHNGSYGSGRFCSYDCKQKFCSLKGASKGGQSARKKLGIKCKCEFCNKEFDTKLSLKEHLSKCEKRIKYNSLSHNNWKCPFCKEIFRTRDLLQIHKKEFHKIKTKLGGCQESNYQIGYCKFCGHKSTTKSGLTYHENRCKENPNRVDGNSKGRRLSEETKKKISESMKNYLEKHPDMAGFKLNHSSKESYPERYFREWLQKENIFSNQEFQVGLYSLDFAWPEKMIYLEIDGSQHQFEWMQIHDKERTEKLSEKGWKCIQRVNWSEYQSLSKVEKEKYLISLKEKIIK